MMRAAAALIALGVFCVTGSFIAWQMCWGPGSQSVACWEAMSNRPGQWVPLTAGALAVLVAAAALRPERGRKWAGIALAIVLAGNPILDPGLFWMGWDTADFYPGNGILGGVALMAAGAVLAWGALTPPAQTKTAA